MKFSQLIIPAIVTTMMSHSALSQSMNNTDETVQKNSKTITNTSQSSSNDVVVQRNGEDVTNESTSNGLVTDNIVKNAQNAAILDATLGGATGGLGMGATGGNLLGALNAGNVANMANGTLQNALNSGKTDSDSNEDVKRSTSTSTSTDSSSSMDDDEMMMEMTTMVDDEEMSVDDMPMGDDMPVDSAMQEDVNLPIGGGSEIMESNVTTDGDTTADEAMETADVNVIKEALKNAKPGDTIEVPAGLYVLDEPLVINNHNIIITTATEDEPTILDASQLPADVAAITIKGHNVELHNMHIMNANNDAVHVFGNKVKLEDNVISGSMGSGIVAKQANSVRLYDNEVKNSGELAQSTEGVAGIVIDSTNKVTLKGNHIYGSNGAGVSVVSGNDIRIESNKINDNSTSQVALYKGTKIAIEMNDIFAEEGSESAAITFSPDREMLHQVNIKNNYIYNMAEGLRYNESANAGGMAKIDASNNTIYNTAEAPLAFPALKSGMNEVTLSKNMIHTNADAFLADNSTSKGLTFESNCFDDANPLPSAATGNGNVSAEIKLNNQSTSITAPNNLISTGKVCENMDAGVQGFVDIKFIDSDVELARATMDGTIEADGSGNVPAAPQEPEMPTAPETPQTPDQTMQPTTQPTSDDTSEPVEEQQQPGGFMGAIMDFISKLITDIVTGILNAIFGMPELGNMTNMPNNIPQQTGAPAGERMGAETGQPAALPAATPNVNRNTNTDVQTNNSGPSSARSTSTSTSTPNGTTNRNTNTQNNTPTRPAATPTRSTNNGGGSATPTRNTTTQTTPTRQTTPSQPAAQQPAAQKPAAQTATTTSNDAVGSTAPALNAVNKFRAENGLPALKSSALLNKASQFQSDEMAKATTMSHTIAGELGPRVTAAGYQWSTVAENIAFGQRSYEEAVEGWINSPPHRKNLLNPNVTEVGFAVTTGPDGRQYWTNILAAPR